MKQIASKISGCAWRQFGKLPLVLQIAMGAGCVGTILMGVSVGDVGVALMGTALGIWGVGVGFALGFIAVVTSWRTSAAFRIKKPNAQK